MSGRSLLGRLFGRAPRPAPAGGRHSRALAGPSVPGAAASLVQQAAAADALAAAVAEVPQPPVPVLTAPTPARAPVQPLGLEDTAVQAPPPIPAWSRPVEVGAAAQEAPVTLGFADGASVALPADDPRVRTFRAAAAALLDAPRG